MDYDTEQFIDQLEWKMKVRMNEANGIIKCTEKEKTGELLQSVLQDINIMRGLVEVYLPLENGPVGELIQFQEKLLHNQNYIETEYNKLMSIIG
ncbi:MULTISPECIES: hypothetical protein [Bacillus cereus group]|uniref:hypothetical protein n=1 Tax=Bacillus cereus group TaxID=86661 RepID=UPI000BFA426D|nr:MULTISPECIES: hypothetical protein [Bacillus cereus group]EKS7857843.1 hypothetical protein [Bacillus cereus]MBE4942205.1 hypothetical protein [Bacillus thuringiensis]MCC2386528.1 hypothetical protein [Bacillus cereus]MCP9281114.1 hypothetical protein [Bacillus wiedmannii]MDF9536464.1 hypothetical protein [Bacillus cereus]